MPVNGLTSRGRNEIAVLNGEDDPVKGCFNAVMVSLGSCPGLCAAPGRAVDGHGGQA